MKLISWNVNGLRACLKKGFADSISNLDADIVCLQETKMEQGQAEVNLPQYQEFWNSSLVKKGYSGTAVFTKCRPVSQRYGIGIERHDQEGRVITLEYDAFFLVNVYTPNSQQELARLDYRMEWENDFRAYLSALDKEKPVILCGDLNVAHKEIDLKKPKTNTKNAGFTPQEREQFDALLTAGFCDTFRTLHPDAIGAYSWWSYRFNARANNAGWRIDYFLVSERIMPLVKDAVIYSDIFGSDHCPVGIEIDI